MSPQGTIGSVSTVTTWVTNTFDHVRRETAVQCKGCGRVSWTGGGVSTESIQHSWFIEEGVSGRVVLGEVVRFDGGHVWLECPILFIITAVSCPTIKCCVMGETPTCRLMLHLICLVIQLSLPSGNSKQVMKIISGSFFHPPSLDNFQW